MPFTHKDGTLVFVDKKDVNEYVGHRMDRRTNQDRNYYLERFADDVIDNYYLTAITNAESLDELEAFTRVYNKIIGDAEEILSRKDRTAKIAIHNAFKRLEKLS